MVPTSDRKQDHMGCSTRPEFLTGGDCGVGGGGDCKQLTIWAHGFHQHHNYRRGIAGLEDISTRAFPAVWHPGHLRGDYSELGLTIGIHRGHGF